ncbi:MAG TPA: NnrS family protein, partial [Chthoniobacteraceae bacterium]|nr:NnrS family protein [Chthoniobacteraceae bacterium]
LLLHIGGTGAHLGGHLSIGDALFAAAISLLVFFLGRRFAARDELPPPAFVLVGFGLLNGVAGAATLAWVSHFPSWPWLYAVGSLMLYQGFVTLPILGVGTFLFPRFIGVPGPSVEASRWKFKASIAALTAVLIIGSFFAEALGHLRAAGAIRFSVAFLYAVTQMPVVLKLGRAPLIGQCIRVAVWTLLLGLLWPVFLPGYRVTGLHVVFIGGFMLIVFAVATRVILSHSGQVHLSRRPLSYLIIASILLLLGMLTRVGADFMPLAEGRNVHLIYAAILCIGAGLAWGVRVMPRVLVPDLAEEEENVDAEENGKSR